MFDVLSIDDVHRIVFTASKATALVGVLAVAVCACTGALVAARREMDPIGFVFMGTVTGIGGGTFRDLVLGVQPVFWVVQPEYLGACIIASLTTFWAARFLNSRYRALLWVDAVGLGMFAVIGTQKAVDVGASWIVAVTMGVLTVAVGGLLRDVMGGEKPFLFHREIYATAAIAGSLAYLGLLQIPVAQELAAFGGFCIGFGIRAAAIIFGLTMIHYVRPDRPLDGPPPEG